MSACCSEATIVSPCYCPMCKRLQDCCVCCCRLRVLFFKPSLGSTLQHFPLSSLCTGAALYRNNLIFSELGVHCSSTQMFGGHFAIPHNSDVQPRAFLNGVAMASQPL